MREFPKTISTADATRPRWCRNCHYSLLGLREQQRCPECGQAFNFDDPRTYDSTIPGNRIKQVTWACAGCFLGAILCFLLTYRITDDQKLSFALSPTFVLGYIIGYWWQDGWLATLALGSLLLVAFCSSFLLVIVTGVVWFPTIVAVCIAPSFIGSIFGNLTRSFQAKLLG